MPRRCSARSTRRLEQLEGEDARLGRLQADAEPGKAILKEAASGKS
jgi:hypothetical protein